MTLYYHRLLVLISVVSVLATGRVAAQDNVWTEAAGDQDGSLTTRAERTNFRETARYEEVWNFTDKIASSSDQIWKTTFGYTTEGRALPLLVFGDVASGDPEAVRLSGKTRVYVQGNIHAGEVCGKEAIMLLLRDLMEGKHSAWSDSLVVLFAPIYNADGNERFNITNRGVQNGPVGGMGQRPNAGDYDLNRDHMKLDSPEARSLLRMVNDYDPHLSVDLHTTNGTHHAYHVTYSPPLHPNTPGEIDHFLRDEFLPTVTTKIRDKYNWEYYYYGNVPRRGEAGWYTFDHRPRFSSNYAGLRNRMAILSEAYAYLSFQDRVMATKYFVEEILDYAHAHATDIRDIVERADSESVVGKQLAVTATFEQSPEPVEILLGEVEEVTNPYSGERLYNRLDVRTPTRMYEYGSFTPTASLVAPAAYAVLPGQTEVIKRLRFHGVDLTEIMADVTLPVERFRIDSTSVSTRSYQGHNAVQLTGEYEPSEQILPAGAVVVNVDQPLGRLAFSLLEPTSDDGFASWGLVDLPEDEQAYYPVFRLTEVVR